MGFNDLVKAADSRVFRSVGEPCTVFKVVGAETLLNVMVVIDRGVEVLLGDVSSIGNTVSYRGTDTGTLKSGDTVTTEGGDVFLLNRRLEGDGDVVTRIATLQP